MKLKLPLNVSNLKADDNFVRYTSQIFSRITAILNGQIEFTDNCKTSLVTVAFSTANVQQAVPHGLESVPVGYLTVGSQSTGVVYDGSSSATAQYLYVQCSVAETKKLLIF